jgi:hypothetical protein
MLLSFCTKNLLSTYFYSSFVSMEKSNLFQLSAPGSVVKSSFPERSYCTCCGGKFYTRSMVKVYYNLLKKTAMHCRKCMSAYTDNLYNLPGEKDRYLIELFSGSKSVTRAAQAKGYKTFCIDIEEKFSPDLQANILDLSLKQLPLFNRCSFLWASVPCTTYSVLSLSKHWRKRTIAHRRYTYEPVTRDAVMATKILAKTLWLIEKINPLYYVIENPRGALRHFPGVQSIPFRSTVSYSDYSMEVYKPTDIFHNMPFLKLKQIKGSAGRVFSQSVSHMPNAFERSKVPGTLIDSILDQIDLQA